MIGKREIDNVYFMAYARPIRLWFQERFDIDFREYELLHYLFYLDENKPRWNKHDFKEGELGMSWNRKRMDRLVERDFIKLKYKGKPRLGEQDLWTFTPTGRRRMGKLYKMLVGMEQIPMNHKYQPFLKDSRKLTMMKKFNRDRDFQK